MIREEQVAGAIDEATKRWGRLDVMYNNAGFGGAIGPIASISEEDYDLTMDVLLKGPFFGIKHAAAGHDGTGVGLDHLHRQHLRTASRHRFATSIRWPKRR